MSYLLKVFALSSKSKRFKYRRNVHRLPSDKSVVRSIFQISFAH